MIQTVREKFTCRDCEKISQPPAFGRQKIHRIICFPPSLHATPRGWAGPHLLATILFESEERSCVQDRSVQWTDRSDERPERKRRAGQLQPLNRQAERYAREGVELSLSTLADQVGACAAALEPIHALIRAHVLAAERLHGDDTTVPLLAKGGTRTARLCLKSATIGPFQAARHPRRCSPSPATAR